MNKGAKTVAGGKGGEEAATDVIRSDAETNGLFASSSLRTFWGSAMPLTVAHWIAGCVQLRDVQVQHMGISIGTFSRHGTIPCGEGADMCVLLMGF